MIHIITAAGRETMQWKIQDKVVMYKDRRWPDWIQVLPLDEMLLEKLKKIGGSVQVLAALLIDANSGKNKKEWEEAKNDQEVADIIVRDSRLQGCNIVHMKCH